MEILLILGNGIIIRPGLRNGHHHSKRKIHAVHHHKFQCIIQHGRIRPAPFHYRKDLGKLPFKIPGRHVFFPRQHPVHVSLDGIDLTIVNNEAVRMCALPAWLCVGAESGMDHGDG